MNKCKWPGNYAFKNNCYCNSSNLCPYTRPDKPLNDLVFGDEIEVMTNEGWKSAKFVCASISYITVLMLNENVTTTWTSNFFPWRLPLKSRMRKGQPIFVDNKLLRIFSHFEGDKLYAFDGSAEYNRDAVYWKDWELPTKAELEEIGHVDGGWLTKEDECLKISD